MHRFGREGGDWGDSADALLVWLHWMDDGKGRFVRAQGILNQHVFRGTPKVLKGIRKDPPEALVSNGDKSHRLDQLSSGERSLVQVFLRLHAHLTCNTILLIDELDLHLHPRWRRRAVRALKETALANPGLTVIFVAHSLDVLDWFDPEIPEPPLRKSGHIIMEGFVGAPGEGA